MNQYANLQNPKLPVIFNYDKTALGLYLPFRVTGVKAEFIDYLKREMEIYCENAIIEPIGHKFVAYRLGWDNLSNVVNDLIKDTPVILRLSGFDKIIPYHSIYD